MAITRKPDNALPPALTEGIMQECLYWWTLRKGHKWQAPNVYVYDWESDLLTVTKVGFVHEFEIKVSRSDFKADAYKVGKHDVVATGSRPLTEREKFSQYYRTESAETIVGKRPNYFWYVCPADMIIPADVPSHAGLITIQWNKYLYRYDVVTVLKNAPRVHKETITIKQMSKFLNSLYYRYWRLRNNLSGGANLLEIEQPTVGEAVFDTQPDNLTPELD